MKAAFAAALVVVAAATAVACGGVGLTGDPRRDILDELDRIERWMPEAAERLDEHYAVEEANFAASLEDRCMHIVHALDRSILPSHLETLYPDLGRRWERCSREAGWAGARSSSRTKRWWTRRPIERFERGYAPREVERLRQEVVSAPDLRTLVGIAERTEALHAEYGPECIERFMEISSPGEARCGRPGRDSDDLRVFITGRSAWYDAWTERYQ